MWCLACVSAPIRTGKSLYTKKARPAHRRFLAVRTMKLNDARDIDDITRNYKFEEGMLLILNTEWPSWQRNHLSFSRRLSVSRCVVVLLFCSKISLNSTIAFCRNFCCNLSTDSVCRTAFAPLLCWTIPLLMDVWMYELCFGYLFVSTLLIHVLCVQVRRKTVAPSTGPMLRHVMRGSLTSESRWVLPDLLPY